MPSYFSKKWDELIAQPDWYLGPLWNEYMSIANASGRETTDKLKQARQYFAERLKAGKVAIGSSGKNFDELREPVDTVVIHHTSSMGEYDLNYLNAVHLLNIYVPSYRNPSSREMSIKGKPVWSGHFYKGRQVFWGYHWIVRPDGESIRLLPDNAIGWHAGSWGINRRSIGICLDGDFMDSTPTDRQLNSLNKLIKGYTDRKTGIKIIPHKDANPMTECPGNTFDIWKHRIAT